MRWIAWTVGGLDRLDRLRPADTGLAIIQRLRLHQRPNGLQKNGFLRLTRSCLSGASPDRLRAARPAALALSAAERVQPHLAVEVLLPQACWYSGR
jgi:hypothetical protein